MGRPESRSRRLDAVVISTLSSIRPIGAIAIFSLRLPKTAFDDELHPFITPTTLFVESSEDDEEESRDIATWMNTWQIPDMQCVLMNIAQGRDQEATRQVKYHYAVWLKAQRPVATRIPRRRVAELRELAISAAVVRREREARVKEKRDTERRQQREAELRRMMSTSDKYWKMAHEQASRGNASGYEKAVCVLKALAVGYVLIASREVFDHELRRFLVRHATRAALLRRLADAGLWSG